MSDVPGSLKKTLGPWLLWGLGVGYVISGEYFGWNLGLPVAGTYGMLAATLAVTVMYVAFSLSYAELACAIPHAGGAFTYAGRALGPNWGFVAGACQVIEFVFAPPAIALAIGAYLHNFVSGVSPVVLGTCAYLLFTGLNIYGVKQAATFELVVTVVAVFELLVFVCVAAPHFSLAHFKADALPHGWLGAFAALPFAIWFYLGIECLANAAEEAEHPQRDIALGFGTSIGTLVALALLIFVSAIGIAGWSAVVYPAPGADASDSPLPLAMAQAVSRDHWLFSMLVGIGLFGLLASFHGILLAAGRATMELGRGGYAPSWVGQIHTTRATPAPALVVNMIVGLVALFTGKTAEIITLSVFGALGLYIISMVTLFALRKKEPNLARPFHAVLYPWSPALALVLALVCLIAMTYYNLAIGGVFAAIITIGFVLQRVLVQRPQSG